MGYGLDSPGNQPIGPPYGRPKYVRSKCVNHNKRDAVAGWGVNLERVCLECLDRCVKEAKRRKSAK